MASSINAITTGTGGVVTTGDNSGVLNLQTGNITAVTVDASQNVGIGTASPYQAKLDINGTGGTGNVAQIAASNASTDQVLIGIKDRGTASPIMGMATGSAFIAAIGNGTTVPLGIGTFGAQPLIFGTTNTERMRLDASGNLGLGVTPSAWGSTYKAFEGIGGSLGSNSSGALYLLQNSYFNGTNFIYTTTALASRYQQSAGTHQWYTAPSGTAGNAITFTQAMTMNAIGQLSLGSTSPVSAGWLTLNYDGQNYNGLMTRTTTSGTYYGAMFKNVSDAFVGNISVSASATAYNTSSDYRLKDNVAPMTGALARVALLKPVTYSWKIDGSAGEGFIAHELQEVCPLAVTGEKDAVFEDGSVKSQSIDVSFLVATLTAAIQEQQALIENLTTRLSALEAK